MFIILENYYYDFNFFLFFLTLKSLVPLVMNQIFCVFALNINLLININENIKFHDF